MTTLSMGSLSLLSSSIGENPFPFFRDQKLLRDVQLRGPFPLELREMLGWQTTICILPYRMQDRYTRKLTSMDFKSIRLENERLSATFLPELGGRLFSLFDKEQNRELLSTNFEIQPANLAIRDAWFAGGIEWNIGRFGHSALTCTPVFAAEIRDWNDEPGLRIYEYERTQCLFWKIDFYLPRNCPHLSAFTQVVNLRDEPTSMYWWTNMAVTEVENLRVLAPAQRGIINMPSTDTLEIQQLPYHFSGSKEEISYPAKVEPGYECFMLSQSADMPWIAAVDEKGAVFFEASAPFLGARKLFSWGLENQGRRWQQYLSKTGKPYVEIQAGLAPTQLNGLSMPAETTWSWLEVFGALQANPKEVHDPDWQHACKAVDREINAKISLEQLIVEQKACSVLGNKSPIRIICEGSGWGALESVRLSLQEKKVIPTGFNFPPESLRSDQEYWLKLLQRKKLPPRKPGCLPGEWMTQKEWRILLQNNLLSEKNNSWFAWLHLGVMLYESSDEYGAEQAWLNSITAHNSVWAYRNLACLYKGQGQNTKAINFYRLAWSAAQNITIEDQTSLAKEFLKFLVTLGLFDQAFDFYIGLSATSQNDDRIKILFGQISLQRGDMETVEKILDGEYAVIRENETTLKDLWVELSATKMAVSHGKPVDDEWRNQVKRDQTPPFAISF